MSNGTTTAATTTVAAGNGGGAAAADAESLHDSSKRTVESDGARRGCLSATRSVFAIRNMFALFLALVMALAAVLFPAEAQDVQCHPSDTHFVDDPRECHMYFTCYQGEAFPMMCPPGFMFVDALQGCYQVPVEECFPCPTSGIQYFEHPKSCSKYVMCFQGAAHEMQCAEGLLFNPVVRQCDLEANVECAV